MYGPRVGKRCSHPIDRLRSTRARPGELDAAVVDKETSEPISARLLVVDD
jgi:hypothetical protein